jgi:hypothetical protein
MRVTVLWDAVRVVEENLTDVSGVLTALKIALMMEAESTYESSLNICQNSRRNTP